MNSHSAVDHTVADAVNPFMSKFPEQYLQEPAENKIDMLIGYTSAVSSHCCFDVHYS